MYIIVGLRGRLRKQHARISQADRENSASAAIVQRMQKKTEIGDRYVYNSRTWKSGQPVCAYAP